LSLSPSVSVARMTSPLFTEKITFYSGSSATRASLNGNSQYRDLFFGWRRPDFVVQLLETISFSMAILAASCGVTTGYSYPLLSGQ
jgi:hypothetical protein